MKEIILLGAIFTLPAWFIIIRNFLWDLSFWQKKNFSTEKFSQNILWDLDKDKISTYLIFIKFIALAFLTLGFQYFVSGVIAIGILLIVWSFEAFWRLEFVFLTKEPKVDIFKPRNLISILSFLTFLIYIFLWITLPFIETVDSNPNVNYQLQLAYQIPSAYVYLLIITGIFSILDLSTSLLTSLQQILINKAVKLRRVVKLFLFQNLTNNLRSKNRIILNAGNPSFELLRLFQNCVENGVGLDVTDPNQVNEFILDNKLKDKLIFVNFQGEIKSFIEIVNPEVVLLNSIEINLSKILREIPAKAKVVANLDIFNKTEIAKAHKGEISFFSGKHIKGENSDTTFAKYVESKDSEIKLTLSVNGKEVGINLNTLNREYITGVVALVALLKELEIKQPLSRIENYLNSKKHGLFIDGDNDTRIISFEKQELNYHELSKSIHSALRQKGGKKLLVLTNGLGIKNIPEEFFDLVKSEVDIFITNDRSLNNQLDKRGIRNYHSESFKNLTYLARKYSEAGDILLVEGHFKDPIVNYLKKN